MSPINQNVPLGHLTINYIDLSHAKLILAGKTVSRLT